MFIQRAHDNVRESLATSAPGLRKTSLARDALLIRKTPAGHAMPGEIAQRQSPILRLNFFLYFALVHNAEPRPK